MKTERHSLIVNSSAPPEIQVDTQAASVYIRFKKAVVARTVPLKFEHMHMAIDLDINGGVIGIESVGITEFSIEVLLKRADVKAPNIDFSRARYVPAEFAAA